MITSKNELFSLILSFFTSDVVVPEGQMQGEPLFYFVLSHSTECARMGTLNYIFHLDDMESLSFKFKDPEGEHLQHCVSYTMG